MRTKRGLWLALVLGGVALAWAASIAVFGGFSLRVFGIPVSSHDPSRGLLVGAILGAIGLIGVPISVSIPQPDVRRGLEMSAAAALAVITIVFGVVYGTFVAGGADVYGYVSQADHWTAGRVVVEAPMAASDGWPDSEWALTPLGYRPALEPGYMVPVYPPGLPLLMSLFERLGGAKAAYLIVPALAGLSVWLVYMLGNQLGGAGTGLLSATALLSSPIFLFQLMFPMSDVPAMALWLLATVCALGKSPVSTVVSAVATAVAIAVRPNLALLAIPMAMLVATRIPGARRLRQGALWATVAACGPIGVAMLNTRLYGSPFSSGYDRLANLYSWSYAATNISRYGTWLVVTQTPFVLLGLTFLRLFGRRSRLQAVALHAWALAFALCVALCYVWYLPFDNWSYLRFLLPALPMLLATASAALVLWLGDSPRGHGVILATGLLLVCHGLWQGRLAFGVREGEGRYRLAGEMTRVLPDDAVVIANLHSGSVRYYGARLTVRYEWLGADEYVPALEYLHKNGRPVYALLDDSELDTFRGRYATVADLSWMNDRPLAIAAGRVFLYSIPVGP